MCCLQAVDVPPPVGSSSVAWPLTLAYPARLAFYVAIGFVLAMLAIATAAVTGYFLFEAFLEMMSRF